MLSFHQHNPSIKLFTLISLTLHHFSNSLARILWTPTLAFAAIIRFASTWCTHIDVGNIQLFWLFFVTRVLKGGLRGREWRRWWWNRRGGGQGSWWGYVVWWKRWKSVENEQQQRWGGRQIERRKKRRRTRVREERENWYPEERVTEIAPPLPLSHLQLLNDIPDRVREVESVVNSNILPFPFNRLIFSNLTSSHIILPLPISNSGVLLLLLPQPLLVSVTLFRIAISLETPEGRELTTSW